jgi:glycosyltransferase involved in cell wall biosynthesis
MLAKKNICIIAPGILPLILGIKPEYVIGPDVHTYILINRLLNDGFKITCITSSKENEHPVSPMSNLDIIAIQEPQFNFRAVYIILKVLAIWSALLKADADIYYHAGAFPGPISIFCRVMNKKFIYGIASDGLVDKKVVSRRIREFSQSKLSLGRLGNWIDIMLADVLIVQSDHQKTLLKEHFERDGILIKMPFPIAPKKFSHKASPPIVMWVGSMAEVKQPELFLKLAEVIPEARFQMIGGHSGNQEFYNSIKDASGKLKNLVFLGVVPFNEIDKYFMKASVLVNTSMFEGFPNAFIQAWMHHVPVVRLNADPDELLCEKKLGFHSKTFEKMVEDLRILLNNEKLREEMGKNAREYAEKEHDIKNNIQNYIDVFNIL